MYPSLADFSLKRDIWNAAIFYGVWFLIAFLTNFLLLLVIHLVFALDPFGLDAVDHTISAALSLGLTWYARKARDFQDLLSGVMVVVAGLCGATAGLHIGLIPMAYLTMREAVKTTD